MTTSLQIDFVSDIACPWCAVGLGALEQALAHVQGDISAELHFQPFELNPHMGPEGQDVGEHLAEKYGSTPEQQAQIRETLRQRGAEVGFTFTRRCWTCWPAPACMRSSCATWPAVATRSPPWWWRTNI